jgi:hypothetical protein
VQRGSDLEYALLQQAYREEVHPRLIGNKDGTSRSPGVSPTGLLVVGVEGAALGDVARTVERAVDKMGGRPVVIDTTELRRMHDRFVPADAADIESNIAQWTLQLVNDATSRRLDPIVAMAPDSCHGPLAMVGELHERGCEVASVVMSANPASAERAVRARALSGEPGDQLALARFEPSSRLLPATVDQLDRDPRVIHIRVIDDNHRTIHRADASRHVRGEYQARRYVAAVEAVSTRDRNPFGRNGQSSQGRGASRMQ